MVQMSDLNDRRIAFVECASVGLRASGLDKLEKRRGKTKDIEVRAKWLVLNQYTCKASSECFLTQRGGV